MKRSDTERPKVCLTCGRVQADGDLGWETFKVGDATLHLCGRHAGAFAAGVEWADLGHRRPGTAECNASPPSDAKVAQQEREQEERRVRVEARLRSITAFDLTPRQIHAELSRRVAGQDEAKRVLATALRSHCKRVQMRMIEANGKRPTVKANLIPRQAVILLGPTGCGKSFTCRTMSRIASVPYWSDALSKFTAEGWVGNSVEELLGALISVSDSYRGLFETGILFLDEIDKKARRNVSGSRDVGGEDLQFSLLEMLDSEGTTLFVCPFVGGRRNPNQPLVEFDTRDLMFILGGAFVGLADIVARRLGGKTRLGFETLADTPRDRQMRESELLHQALPCDLIEFGLIPELVGRCGTVAVFDPLSRDDLRHIMVDVDDAVVTQQQCRARLEQFDLEITPEAVDAICGQAYASGMGARRLRSLTSEVLTRIFFDLPTHRKVTTKPRVIVTAATVADPTAYEVVRPQVATRRVAPQQGVKSDVVDAIDDAVSGECRAS